MSVEKFQNSGTILHSPRGNNNRSKSTNVERKQSNKNNPYLNMLRYARKNKNVDLQTVDNLLSAISVHESKYLKDKNYVYNDPKSKQVGGGPGRGLFMFEKGDNRGANTAYNRLRNIMTSMGLTMDDSKWRKFRKNDFDATYLNENQQRALALANFLEHPTADIDDLENNKKSFAKFWAINHQTENDPSKISNFIQDYENIEERNLDEQFNSLKYNNFEFVPGFQFKTTDDYGNEYNSESLTEPAEVSIDRPVKFQGGGDIINKIWNGVSSIPFLKNIGMKRNAKRKLRKLKDERVYGVGYGNNLNILGHLMNTENSGVAYNKKTGKIDIDTNHEIDITNANVIQNRKNKIKKWFNDEESQKRFKNNYYNSLKSPSFPEYLDIKYQQAINSMTGNESKDVKDYYKKIIYDKERDTYKKEYDDIAKRSRSANRKFIENTLKDKNKHFDNTKALMTAGQFLGIPRKDLISAHGIDKTAGYYSPSKNYISFNHPFSIQKSESKYDALTHELVHAYAPENSPGQKKLIQNTLKNYKNKEALSSKSSKKDYYSDPSEIYARIMEVRIKEGLKPGEKVDKKDLKKWRKKDLDEMKDLNIIKDEGLLKLFNELASNNNSNIPKNIAQTGGYVNNTGYTPGTQSYNNPYNVIPSNNITMENTPFPVLGIPNDGGQPKIMYPGENHIFANAQSVLELPLFKYGSGVPKYQKGDYIKPITNIQKAQRGTTVGYGQNLPTLTYTANLDNVNRYREQYNNAYPIDVQNWINDRVANPQGRDKILAIDKDSYREELLRRLINITKQRRENYVADQILQDNPQGDRNRVDYLNSLSDREEQFLKQQRPGYQTSYLEDAATGLMGLVANSQMAGKAKRYATQANPNLTKNEKVQRSESLKQSPIMTALGDAGKTLGPMFVPGKTVQSLYRDDYSISDALQGKKNKASLPEDLLTDITAYSGLGLLGKSNKLGKILKGLENSSKTRSFGELDKSVGLNLRSSPKIPKEVGIKNRPLADLGKVGKGSSIKFEESHVLEDPVIEQLEMLTAVKNSDEIGSNPFGEMPKEFFESTKRKLDKLSIKNINKLSENEKQKYVNFYQNYNSYFQKDVAKHYNRKDVNKVANNYINNVLNSEKSLKKARKLDEEYGTALENRIKTFSKQWNSNKHENPFEIKIGDLRAFNEDDVVRNRGVYNTNTGHIGISEKVSKDQMEKTLEHEIAHSLNMAGEAFKGTKKDLGKDLKSLFYTDVDNYLKARKKMGRDLVKINKEKGLPRKGLDEAISKEMNYINQPTETQSFLSTNLRRDLKAQGIIDDMNANITLPQAEKSTTYNRFKHFIKDKPGFIKMVNKLTPAIAGALGLKAINIKDKNKNDTVIK